MPEYRMLLKRITGKTLDGKKRFYGMQRYHQFALPFF
jgi:hypothetical protein